MSCGSSPLSRAAIEIEIGSARLAGIAEFAETDVAGCDAFGERQQRKTIGRTDFAGGIRTQKRAGAQQRILPADPKLAAADFAVRDAFEMRAEGFTDGAKDIFDGVETDAADEMNVHGAPS